MKPTNTEIACMTGSDFEDYLDSLLGDPSPYACPACSHVEGNEGRQDSNGVTTCGGCNALFGTRAIYAGESHVYVLPHMSQEADPAETRYFDFTVLNGAGIRRRHGWFDPKTKLVVQTG